MQAIRDFTKLERTLWLISVFVITLVFVLTGQAWLTLFASLFGVSALMFLAKGEPLGQLLVVAFGLLYAVVSYQMRYYGEMFTYLGMTLPSAIFAFFVWMRHPHQKGQTTVRVGTLSGRKILLIVLLAPLVTVLFYVVLASLDTAELLLSTASIFTSVVASLFMFFRVRYYALAYALNDIVLIALWLIASLNDASYLPMVLCFFIFLLNDLYGFYNWRRLEATQQAVVR